MDHERILILLWHFLTPTCATRAVARSGQEAGEELREHCGEERAPNRGETGRGRAAGQMTDFFPAPAGRRGSGRRLQPPLLQNGEGEHCEQHVVLQARPAPALEVVQAHLFLELLVR
jgi:hypothetical protein